MSDHLQYAQVYGRLSALRNVDVPNDVAAVGAREFDGVGTGLLPRYRELADMAERYDRELVELRLRVRDLRDLCKAKSGQLMLEEEFATIKPAAARDAAIEDRVHAEHGEELSRVDAERMRLQALRDAVDRTWTVVERAKEVWNAVGRRADREMSGPGAGGPINLDGWADFNPALNDGAGLQGGAA